MPQFSNVTAIKKANIYFNGNVTSRTIFLPDGSKKTLGIMMPGDYEFGTDVKEIMEILSGDLQVQLPGETEWIKFAGSGEFTVEANQRFKLKVATVTDYCCSYLS